MMWTRIGAIVFILLAGRIAPAEEAGKEALSTRHLLSSIDVRDFGAETLRQPLRRSFSSVSTGSTKRCKRS